MGSLKYQRLFVTTNVTASAENFECLIHVDRIYLPAKLFRYFTVIIIFFNIVSIYERNKRSKRELYSTVLTVVKRQ